MTNNKLSITLEITNCTECKNLVVTPDPDPDDWFCDDVKAMCKAAKNQVPTLSSGGYICAEEPYVTVGCRPYKLNEECGIPDWCPLLNKNSNG